QQETNQNAGTKEIIDAGDSDKEDESAQDCFVLPIWPSYSSIITPALITYDKREDPREEEQVFMDDLERLKRQEKEANEEAEALRKKFEHLVIKEGAARSSILPVLMRDYLISWQCKKHTIVATSTTEAEYVAAACCCGQVLWIQNQMLDYGFNFMNTKIYIDNESTICIVKNPVYHSKTKHIAIRHHFIRDAYEKKLIQVLKIHTDDNVADLLTKAFDVSKFQFLVVYIRMINP
ncbi:hypothetical protein Tco_0042864, partial [Tanacetum coccineum]